MTMEQAVKSAYGAAKPLPEAEERMWKGIDEKLGGRAGQIQIGVRRRRRTPWKGFVLAAVAVLALLAVSIAVIQRMNQVTGEPIPAEEPEATPTPTPEPTPTPPMIPELRMIELVNAQVNDSGIFSLSEEGTYLARAVLPEGQCVDHWEVNGQPVDAGERRYSLEFESEGVQKIEAVLREERHITCVNCYLQFLDADGNPSGWMYEELCFEYDYTVPTTGESHPGGSITAVVLPIDPEAEEPSYWVIDGEQIEGFPPAREIRLEELDRSVHIELGYEHGYRDRELSEPIVLTGSGEKELSARRPGDDLPAELTAEPSNAAIEVDYVRDGVPLDPDAPGRDGHTHDWQLDAVNSHDSTCLDIGKHVFICSICGGKHVTWQEKKAHQYHYIASASGHRYACAMCGYNSDPYDPYGWSSHSWVTEGDVKYCSKCGWVYGQG